MTIKMVRIYEVDIEAETPTEDIEKAFYKELEVVGEKNATIGEYIYPDGYATREILEEIEDLL